MGEPSYNRTSDFSEFDLIGNKTNMFVFGRTNNY